MRLGVAAGPRFGKPKGSIGRDDILEALKVERNLIAKGIGYRVKSVVSDGAAMKIELDSLRGMRSSAVDDGLEESSCRWGVDREEFSGGGSVSFVVSDEGAVVVNQWHGPRPEAGHHIRFFQQDFLQPLIEIWESPSGYGIAREMLARQGKEALDPVLSPLESFKTLRQKQAEALSAALFGIGLINGPPGTGKTFALGALVSSFLVRFPERKILLLGPTNVAVDTAICSVDDWLKRLDRRDCARSMKRLGSRFDVRRYSERQHLLEPGLYEKAMAAIQLELEEPSKKEFEKYAIWKAKLGELRNGLKNDFNSSVASSRVIAMTTASALRFFGELNMVSWDLVVADEASQIPFPTALVLGGLAPRTVFAGDPRQLAPVVQEKSAVRVLEKTAFDVLSKRAYDVFLNEQSRMCRHICECVSELFYDRKLIVSSREAADPSWRKSREPYFLQRKKLTHIVLKEIGEDFKWSSKYNGFIRFQSAQFVFHLVDEMLAHTDSEDVVVLTPFRSQRALISEFFRNRKMKVDVSTVHRAQGSERKIVIFDPVSAQGPFINSPAGWRLLNVAFSRAQTHLILPLSSTDFQNPKIWMLREIVARQQSRLTRFDLPSIIR